MVDRRIWRGERSVTSVTGMIDLSGLVEEHRAAVEALVGQARNGHRVEWPGQVPGAAAGEPPGNSGIAGQGGDVEVPGDLPGRMLELPAGRARISGAIPLVPGGQVLT